ncbi:hypothetical protein [Acinetobacter baumannii]|uniref:hypothetical protein n=1 Tax=Acinetobacter baumannii TaxID=470 RepID=UPI000A3515EA|nr:hypothetical protein [Acinetobacter baumannii]OTS28917.1 hypothetical protein CAT07_12085 [Acinetobacter baumannii]
MDKKSLQEQFEALPLMVAILNDSFIYVDQTNEYAHPNLEDNRVTLGYVNGAWYAFQHQQAKVEELQTLYTQQGINMLKLQKRVQFLEQELGAWKGKSIAAMINGMCKQCGKEPWQAIVSDKDGYALLHCFGCGANKYELVGEQALKGEG